ncbi:hypothetical protein APED_14200 [Acanthopleuribacter pedis]
MSSGKEPDCNMGFGAVRPEGVVITRLAEENAPDHAGKEVDRKEEDQWR